MSWKYPSVELINITRGNSLSTWKTRFRGGWSFLRTLFCKWLTSKRRGGWIQQGPGQTEEAKPFTKIVIHLAQSTSENAPTSTSWLSQPETHQTERLFKGPSPAQANTSKVACGLPPNQPWEAAQSEWALLQFSHLKDVAGQEPEHIIRLECSSL